MGLHFYRNCNFLEISIWNYNIDFLRISKFISDVGFTNFKFKVTFNITNEFPKYNERHNNIKALKSFLRREYNAIEDKDWKYVVQNEN